MGKTKDIFLEMRSKQAQIISELVSHGESDKLVKIKDKDGGTKNSSK
jgi:hypothetical protein